MEFAVAISQHLAWKQRLRRILLGRERRKNPARTEAIESDTCELGQWITTAASTYAQEPLFRSIEEQHRLTHDLAIQMVLNDEIEKSSMDMVFQIGRFHMASRTLLESLEKLRRKYALDGEPLCAIPAGFPREEFPAIPEDRG